MKTVIVLPISRSEFLAPLFASLEFLECDPQDTAILCIVDGSVQLYVEARNLCNHSKFGQRLCVQFPAGAPVRKFNIEGRRQRIAEIHNFAKQHITNAKYIFMLEDDTIVPNNTLEKLLNDYSLHPFAGVISGVELGRWGVTYAGIWKADDVYEPKEIRSLSIGTGTEEVDATGFYACLTKAEIYMAHDFKPFEHNDLGPDVDYGIELRRQGYKNYVNWGVQCIHKREDMDISIKTHPVQQVTFNKTDRGWKQRIG